MTAFLMLVFRKASASLRSFLSGGKAFLKPQMLTRCYLQLLAGLKPEDLSGDFLRREVASESGAVQPHLATKSGRETTHANLVRNIGRHLVAIPS